MAAETCNVRSLKTIPFSRMRTAWHGTKETLGPLGQVSLEWSFCSKTYLEKETVDNDKLP